MGIPTRMGLEPNRPSMVSVSKDVGHSDLFPSGASLASGHALRASRRPSHDLPRDGPLAGVLLLEEYSPIIMKTTDPLDNLLRLWNSPSGVPVTLHGQVWHLIAATADEYGRRTVQSSHARIAALAAAVVVVAGFSLGILSEHRSVDRDRDAYFNRIDPIALAQ